MCKENLKRKIELGKYQVQFLKCASLAKTTKHCYMAQFLPNITVIPVDCHLENNRKSKILKIIVRFVPSHNLLAVSNKKASYSVRNKNQHKPNCAN